MNQLELNLEPILYTHETKEQQMWDAKLLALVKARPTFITNSLSEILYNVREYNHGTHDQGKLSQAQIDMMGAEQACLWHVRQKLERMLNQ